MKYETYQLEITDHSDQRVTVRLSDSSRMANKKERRKIYIIYHNKEIFYIGEANSALQVRFQRACTSFNYYKKNEKARNGYKGYKWLDRKANPQRSLKVFAVIFDDIHDQNRDYIEAIEGELVFLVRKNNLKWPEFQNEIHFKNDAGAAEAASEIYQQLLSVL